MNDAQPGVGQTAEPGHLHFLAGGGATGALIRAQDWAATPLGPPESWPVPLRTVVGIMLAANQPMFAAWGPERTMIYNDPYAAILGAKHPAALGRPFFEAWHELKESVGPIMDRAYAGEPSAMDDIALTMLRHGYEEETHFSYFYAPLRDEEGTVRGVYCACAEITERIFAERRAAFRYALEERLRDLADPSEAMAAAADALGSHLGVARVGYAEVDGGWATVEREWNPDGLPTLVGRHWLDDYGPARIAEMRAGRIDVIPDFGTDPRLGPADVAIHHGLGIGAQVVVPLVKAGVLVALLFVHANAPRRWHPEEVAAVEDAAERTWAALGRARADTALRASEARHRSTLEIETVGVVYFDMAGGITDANDAFLRLIGYTRAELEAGEVRYENLTPPDWSWRDERTIAELGATGRSGPFEKEYFRRDGSRMWILCASKLLDERIAVEFIVDVTERRRADEALRESEARYRMLFEAIESGFCIVEVSQDRGDGRVDYRVVEANPAFYPQTGFAEAILGRWLREAVPALEEHWYQTYGRVAATGEAERFEAGSDALGRWFDVYAFRVGQPAERRVAILFNDISARRQAEERLRDLNATLENRVAERTAELMAAEEILRQAQKMEAVGQLTGGIAHDFNNMLQGVAGGLDLARRRIEAGRVAEAGRYLDAARDAAARAATLTRRLLAFARRQALDPRPVDLDGLLRGVAELVTRTVGPAVDVSLRMGDGHWPVLCDPNQMESALLNLAINARDAMPEGGRLTIATRDLRLGPGDLAGHADLRPGEFVEVAVTDTGHGMTPEVAARAFEPFYTTKPTGKGTGLGLSQVYGFVRQSGGLVRLESAPGRGTTVRLLFPRYVGPAAEAEPAAAAPQPAGRASGTVLLVEDEPAVRAQAAEALREAGFRVMSVEDGATALARLRAGLRPDALVTDVGLPGALNGRQVAEAVREQRPGLPVLFITGYAGSALGDALPEGMSVVAKPFALDDLVRRVRAMCERAE